MIVIGKQIDYYIDHDNILLVAQKAVDSGCRIVKEDRETNKVIISDDISIINSDDWRLYFYLPEAGSLEVKKTSDGKKEVDSYGSSSSLTLIEFGCSIINHPNKTIVKNRIYCVSGYYDENEEWIARPECLTKVYNSLVRYIKKLAPFTEIHSTLNGREYIHKEYITPACLDLIENQKYRLIC